MKQMLQLLFDLTAIMMITSYPLRAAAIHDDSGSSPRATRLFDQGWKFHLGDIPDAQATDFDDGGWKQVDLPHDWSVEQPFDSKYSSGTGYLPGGIGWYRKSFGPIALAGGQRVGIFFDGVYKNAEVWINGHALGRRPNGFVGFGYDLTPYLSSGTQSNVLAVRVDHSDYADSRFYTGSGIYRHVWLQTVNALHIARWGTFVSTAAATKESATVNIQTRVVNDTKNRRDVVLVSTILNSAGKPVGSAESALAIDPGKAALFAQTIKVAGPALWSAETPNLYTVVSQLKSESAILDEERSMLGIRTFVFDPDKGFFLNGVKTVFKGVCLHQDEGTFGAAVPEDAMKRRLELLKELGCNAIRTSHDPPAPEFLDLCDRMGFLVMDEAFDEWARPKKKWVEGWNVGKPSFDGYAKDFQEWSIRDLQGMVERDRNHPSIILWSIGNEIDYDHDPYYDPTAAGYTPDKPSAAELTVIAKKLYRAVKEVDPTRPVTAALANIETSNRTGLADVLDVVGYNYQEKFYAQDHARYPARKIIGSENHHTYADWRVVEDLAYANGQFLWTGFDYLGEALPWPMRGASFGVLDECGFKKPAFYFRQSLWSDRPMVYLAAIPPNMPREPGRPRGESGVASWTWPIENGHPISVHCYTNCQKVDLFLNGKSLGQERLATDQDHLLIWNVPWAAGTLKAVGTNGNKEVCSFELKTTGRATAVKLMPQSASITADGRSICFIEADVVDAEGNRVFAADNEIAFDIQGPGKIVGLDSGDLRSHENFRASARKVYQGRCLAIVQSTLEAGTITVKAGAVDLASDQVSITARR
jgi:beta-galactosidase